MKQIQYLAIALWFSFLGTVQAAEFPLTFTDSAGDETTLTARPQRVVSLVPSVTEMLMRIGAAESVVGITHHSLVPYQAGDKTVVGGFLKPDPSRVASLQPDLIFYSDLQSEVIDSFQDETLLIQLSPGSIEESFRQLQLLGKIFAREEQSAEIIKEQRRQLKVIAEKVEKIPQEERLRVMRFMDRQQLLTPGDDSFQNEYIRAAGAIAPSFGKNGNIIGVTPEQLKGFNPQLLYGCGNKKGISPREFAAWGEIDATRNGRVSFFPCDLTCRASTHQGDFVSRLAATIYREQFAREQDFVLPEQVVKRSPLAMDLDYVKEAEILESDIKDFRNKTVAITFHQAMKVVSTLEGERDSITTVANHYFPPPSWGLGHGGGLATLEEETRKVLGFSRDSTAMLFTGADMDNLAVVKKGFQDMAVIALVTAGVKSNALRMGADSGSFYEPGTPSNKQKPGTINILLLTNMQLSTRAMTRAIISATEGKSAALQDLDIRSSYSSALNQATGTGTDNIIVVQGTGTPVDLSGGHTKMGELIARTVYEGVQQAIHKQNGLSGKRSIFQRLKERQINLHQYSHQDPAIYSQLERILLQEPYVSFMAASLAISDDYSHGLINDLNGFEAWCQDMADSIGGREVKIRYEEKSEIPTVINRAISSLVSGIRSAETSPLP